MTYKKPWKAAALNLLMPGLGHAYAHQWQKGLLLFILSLAIIISIRFLAYSFILFALVLTLIIAYYLYLVFSGYRSVNKDKIYTEPVLDKWYFYVLVILGWGILTNSLRGIKMDFHTPINFASIPTPAMDPTLQVGDVLAFQTTKAINRNEVTVFRYPSDENTLFIKRCVGIPGDSLKIIGKKVFINGKPLPARADLKYRYLITTDGAALQTRFLEDQGIQDFYPMPDHGYLAYITGSQAKKLRTHAFIKGVKRTDAAIGDIDPQVFPQSPEMHWNPDFYGTLYIPKKGEQIDLNPLNLEIYSRYIQAEEPSLVLRNGQFYRDGTLVQTYRFRENYYFMMGDSRDNSLDSRYWGFVPERLLVGRSLYFYWSEDLSRIGKSIL